jgi:hypothetical protein
MRPIVTEVEYIDELFPGLETRELLDSLVKDRLICFPLRHSHSDTSAVGKLEFMEM